MISAQDQHQINSHQEITKKEKEKQLVSDNFKAKEERKNTHFFHAAA